MFIALQDQLPRVLDTLRSHKQFVQLEGLHCHLGSTIKTVTIFHDAMVYMLHTLDSLRAEGTSTRVDDDDGPAAAAAAAAADYDDNYGCCFQVSTPESSTSEVASASTTPAVPSPWLTPSPVRMT